MALPPDLARLGDDLLAAAQRATAQRARRRRIATAALAGALAFTAFTPAALTPADRQFPLATTSPGCDHARGAQFTLVACEGPMVLQRPYANN